MASIYGHLPRLRHLLEEDGWPLYWAVSRPSTSYPLNGRYRGQCRFSTTRFRKPQTEWLLSPLAALEIGLFQSI